MLFRSIALKALKTLYRAALWLNNRRQRELHTILGKIQENKKVEENTQKVSEIEQLYREELRYEEDREESLKARMKYYSMIDK